MSQDSVEVKSHKKFEHQAFVSARSLFGLTCGLLPVDSLIGGLQPDTIALLTGSSIRLDAAERYCVRAQLPAARGGLGGGAFFIDGGNSFDVYLFTELVRKHRLTYDAALTRQLLSRAFTIYELRSLIEDSMTLLQTRGPKLLVISEVFSLFTEDVDKAEGERTVSSMADSIYRVSKAHRIPILITSSVRPESLTPVLEEKCNVSAEVVEGDGWLKARLHKHPSKAPFELLKDTSPATFNQDTLRTEAVPDG